MIILERERFHRWLQCRPAATIVGESRNSGGCPIGRWLQDDQDWFFPSVGLNRATDFGRPSRDGLLPLWACQFNEDLDEKAGEESRPIRAASALRVLEGIAI